jgi:hypothetical protein
MPISAGDSRISRTKTLDQKATGLELCVNPLLQQTGIPEGKDGYSLDHCTEYVLRRSAAVRFGNEPGAALLGAV